VSQRPDGVVSSYKLGEHVLLAGRTYRVTKVESRGAFWDRIRLVDVAAPQDEFEKTAMELAVYGKTDYDCEVCRNFANNFHPRDVPTPQEPNHPDCPEHGG